MPSAPVVALRDVTCRYDTVTEPLFRDLTAWFPRGFTGVIGANGAGKTTLLRLVTGTLAPESGTVIVPPDAIYCAQRTDDPPPRLADLLDDNDGATWALRGRLGIEWDFLQRWDTLSHGERKRAQIATALWQAPEVLAIDEPTNHIDRAARRMLIDSLQRWSGAGLIVSHDRDLLDELCGQCLWIDPPGARMYQGGYTRAAAQRDLDRETAVRSRERATAEEDRLKREMTERREVASRAHRERSKRGLDIKDHDARAVKNLARLTGKDGQAGRLLKQMSGRAEAAAERAAAAHVDKEYATGIWLPGSVSKRQVLFHLEPGEVAMGERRLRHPALMMSPTDRIGITGANGLGKSTLLARILQAVAVPQEHLIAMPQEINRAESQAVLESARGLPREALGRVLNIVSRLGSRPQRLLDSEQPSPGEVRKLMLALGMARSPHLIVMDEPTNHLDLPSIEALEAALAECPCGLLLVSHDQRFLEALGVREWRLEGDERGDSTVHVG